MRYSLSMDRRAWFLAIAALVAAPARGQEEAPKPDPVVAELVAAHNRERAEAKLPPLSLEPKLEAAAKAHTRDMAEHETMTHEGSDGSTPADRVKKAGYHYLGTAENVAWGQPDVATVMKGWMDSPPHKENILGDYTQIGVARASAKDGAFYWSVSFGRPRIKLDPTEAAPGLIERLNRERAKAEKPPFQVDSRLAEKAQAIATARSKDKDAPPPTFEGIDARAFKKLAMSLAAGQPTPDAVVKSLIDSPDHKENLLGDFTRIGVGYATAEDDTATWCLILGVPATGK